MKGSAKEQAFARTQTACATRASARGSEPHRVGTDHHLSRLRRSESRRRANARRGPGLGHASVTLHDLHALIFVWANGTPAVQGVAQHTCAQLGMTVPQCAGVSAAVRSGWLDLAARDPAALGRVGATPNFVGREEALGALAGQLAIATGGRTATLLAATQAADAQISQPRWIAANVLGRQAVPAGTVLVWATSYQKASLPNRLNARKSPYAARLSRPRWSWSL